MKQIIFGNASYIKNGIIKSMRLKRGDGWKQSYVAIIIGLDDQHGLKRQFIQMKTEVTVDGKPLMTWMIPIGFSGILEFGWASDNVKQTEASTHYILVLGEQMYELTEAHVYREMRQIAGVTNNAN